MAVPHTLPRRFSIDEYYQMFDAGLFQHERVELIEGEVVHMCPQNVAHVLTITVLNAPFVEWFKPCFVRVQLPFQVGSGSEPEPDFSIVTRDQLYSAARHPTQAELLVEVAESSLAYDRLVKSRLYAMSEVPEYWIINLVDVRVEVYREPKAELYSSLKIYTRGESIQPLRFPGLTIPVSDLLQALP